MKLAGLTWWRNNYGSILQAYALQEEINNFVNVEYEIINQYGKKNASADNLLDKLKTVGIKKTFKRMFWKFTVPNLRSRGKKLQKFVDDNLKLSSRQYNETNIYDANSVYDGFVCGSDQIWNTTLAGTDSMYWLSFAETNKIKFSYAPSIGVERLEPDDANKIRKNLHSFNGVSCREKSGSDLINSVLNDEICETVLDPTMLVDLKLWNDICTPRKYKDRYIFAYFLRGTAEQRKMVERFAHEKDLKIVTMPFLETEYTVWYDIKFGDYKFWDASPEEFISVIRYADYVFTDSFHSTVFSCLYHVPFVIFPKKGKAQMSRLQGLLDLLGIDDRIIQNEKMIEQITLNIIDWEQVDNKLTVERKKSSEYLCRQLQV
ncbi:MAG: polysaccharide pyruvyl transferase family protein [Oscillospiraceae bacterium]|nr:polysaccharide pyruvyl transferase family protein [Oscillospiraceae bacterium]